MRLGTKLAALWLALTAVSPISQAFAGDNWARDHVRRHEAAVLARALGLGPTEQLRMSLVTPARIVGGVKAPPGRWPFQAGLLRASIKSNYNAQFCGGSVIDEEFILTAAHCVDFMSPGQLHVLTETQSLKTGGTRHEVKRIRIHPKYNGTTFDFDVALIQLRKKVDGLRPTQIPTIITRDQQSQLAPPGSRSFVIGWGDTGTGTFPVALREVAVRIVSNPICNSGDSYDGDVTPRMLCAGFANGGKDSCQGDSGGPLLVRDEAGRFRLQVGIVSWGTGCAEPNFYGVYTRLAVLEPWISGKMAALRAAAVSASALACEISGGRASTPACRRAAKNEAEQEMKAFLAAIKRKGTPSRAREAAASQRAWSRSLGGICAFEVAMTGQLGREDCIARQARKRADALAGQLADLPH